MYADPTGELPTGYQTAMLGIEHGPWYIPGNDYFSCMNRFIKRGGNWNDLDLLEQDELIFGIGDSFSVFGDLYSFDDYYNGGGSGSAGGGGGGDGGDGGGGSSDGDGGGHVDITKPIAKDREPYSGFWGTLKYVWTGGIENGIRYNYDGTVAGYAPNMGFPPIPAFRGISINQLQRLVQTGKVPLGITRFDAGTGIPGQLPHVHVNGAALNIDGTWRHGTTILTNQQIKFLLQNGWILPK
jgi:hypothetical protein